MGTDEKYNLVMDIQLLHLCVANLSPYDVQEGADNLDIAFTDMIYKAY